MFICSINKFLQELFLFYITQASHIKATMTLSHPAKLQAHPPSPSWTSSCQPFALRVIKPFWSGSLSAQTSRRVQSSDPLYSSMKEEQSKLMSNRKWSREPPKLANRPSAFFSPSCILKGAKCIYMDLYDDTIIYCNTFKICKRQIHFNGLPPKLSLAGLDVPS